MYGVGLHVECLAVLDIAYPSYGPIVLRQDSLTGITADSSADRDNPA
jgi:hypothetical protein